MSNIKTGSSYTFDSFEVTKANSQAFEKAKQFAENADSKPMAIFGGTATGKTHLLYSVKNAIKQNNTELTVILTTTADMRSALADILNSGGTSEQFREKYLQADVLLVDDIQELAGKETIQNELILIFNSFYESGKRFMMTSSQKEAGYGIQDRLVIREFWGDFAVITRAYIHAQFESNAERINQRKDLLHKSERICRTLLHDEDFDIDAFKSYYKEVWTYFRRYIGLFDMNREDLKIVSYLNRIDTIYTISSYDHTVYEGGFYGNGVLFIPLPHHAGTPDCIEIKIDEFDEEFNKFCERYQRRSRRVSRLHWSFQ